MKIIRYSETDFPAFRRNLIRRAIPDLSLKESVSSIIDTVATHGNAGLFELAQRFDQVELTTESMFISEEEFAEAEKQIKNSTREAIAQSLRNIHAFTEHSKRRDWSAVNEQGAHIGERFTPFDRVGVYVPGGKAPLVSTALMTAGFAQAIGVPQIVAATPCNAQGKVNPELLYALRAAGVTEAIKIGGAHGIAALALGTESLAPVDLIVGPGNRFVVEAKRQLVGAVAIDLLPGPSEILIIADSTGNPDFIAADILAQAEHGGDSYVGFATDCPDLLAAVEKSVLSQLQFLSRKEIIDKVLTNGTFLILLENLEQGIAICNDFAPEHLSLIVQNEEIYLPQIRTAGAIYLGNLSPVAVGDFLAGPSHTLPTGGAGRSFSGLRADMFQRRTSIVRLDVDSVAKSLSVVEEFARIEGLDAHGRSTSIRLADNAPAR